MAAVVLVGLAACTSTVSDLPGLGGSGDVVERTDGLADGGWVGARTTTDGLRIVVIGAPPFREGDPCTADYTAAASVTEDEVGITITTRSPRSDGAYACATVGYPRLIDVAFDGSLGGRTVVFEPFGQTKEVFDGSALLEPTALPAGWALQSEEPWHPGSALGAAWRTAWGEPPEGPTDGRCTSGVAPVSLTQGRADSITFFTMRATAAGQYDVRGRPATYLTDGIAADAALLWTDGPTGYALTTSEACVGDALLTSDQLVELANSLR